MAPRVGSTRPAKGLTAGFLALLSVAALAQPRAPAPPVNYFTDSTGVVSADVAARIEERLREFESSSSNQVVVVVADRIPAGYSSIEEYANRTAQAWRVGQKGRDNGLVLFVFVGDRKMRLEVGYGLEGVLPDALADRIIEDEIAPQFRAGKYGDGLLRGVDAVIQATRGEYRPLGKRGELTPLMMVFIGGVLAFFVLITLLFFFAPSSMRQGHFPGQDHSWGSSDHSSGGDGGGFSGGGGSFGGGGASGSW